jgi:hypothetical protein
VGYEAECRIRYNGQTAVGKALLETSDLIVRGPLRLAVPLASITAATAADGCLSITFDGQRVELEVGAAAPKWAARITNPPSRIQKLGVKPGMVVLAVAIEDTGFLDELAGHGARVVRTAAAGRADLVFYGAEQRAALDRLKDLSTRIKPDGALWVVRPKGIQAITEADVMAAGKRAALVDVKVVSFSPTHTAEKFVIPVALRPPRVAARTTAGGVTRRGRTPAKRS